MKAPARPALDTRRTAEFAAELRERARAWIPSWGLTDDERDFGRALLEIAARFSSEVAERLDRRGRQDAARIPRLARRARQGGAAGAHAGRVQAGRHRARRPCCARRRCACRPTPAARRSSSKRRRTSASSRAASMSSSASTRTRDAFYLAAAGPQRSASRSSRCRRSGS